MRRDQRTEWDWVGRNVREVIAERGTTVSAVADAISVPRSTLRRRLAPGGRLLVDDVVAVAFHLEPEWTAAWDLLKVMFNDRQERHLRAV